LRLDGTELEELQGCYTKCTQILSFAQSKGVEEESSARKFLQSKIFDTIRRSSDVTLKIASQKYLGKENEWEHRNKEGIKPVELSVEWLIDKLYVLLIEKNTQAQQTKDDEARGLGKTRNTTQEGHVRSCLQHRHWLWTHGGNTRETRQQKRKQRPRRINSGTTQENSDQKGHSVKKEESSSNNRGTNKEGSGHLAKTETDNNEGITRAERNHSA
jgi:hypothetical protein